MNVSSIRRRGPLARTVAIALPMALVAAVALPSTGLGAPPPAELFDRNLIVNGNADAGPGSPSSEGGVVPVPGWATSSSFTAVEYELEAGVPDSFPTPDDSIPAEHGSNLFVGGPSNDYSDATQIIAMAAAAKLVDSGLVTYSLSGWLGGFTGQEDNAVLSVSFRRANGQEVGSAVIGPVTASDRGRATGPVLAGFGAERFFRGFLSRVVLAVFRGGLGATRVAIAVRSGAGRVRRDGPALGSRGRFPDRYELADAHAGGHEQRREDQEQDQRTEHRVSVEAQFAPTGESYRLVGTPVNCTATSGAGPLRRAVLEKILSDTVAS